MATDGPPLVTTKCVMATGGAAMGSAEATGGLPWVVSTGNYLPKTDREYHTCIDTKSWFEITNLPFSSSQFTFCKDSYQSMITHHDFQGLDDCEKSQYC